MFEKERVSCSDPAQLPRGSLSSTLCGAEQEQREQEIRGIKKTTVFVNCFGFSTRRAGVNESSQRTGRRWLHSNILGGSVTVLFLAPPFQGVRVLRKL